MTVYIDDLQLAGTERTEHARRVGGRHGHYWCHMWCDGDLEELHAMAQRIGLKRSWFQVHSSLLHYDVVPTKRDAALKAGAQYMPLTQWLKKQRGQ